MIKKLRKNKSKNNKIHPNQFGKLHIIFADFNYYSHRFRL
jgi:hypothetical protein